MLVMSRLYIASASLHVRVSLYWWCLSLPRFGVYVPWMGADLGVTCLAQAKACLCVVPYRRWRLLLQLAGFRVCMSQTGVACAVQLKACLCAGLFRCWRLPLARFHVHVSQTGVSTWAVYGCELSTISCLSLSPLADLSTCHLCPLPCLRPCLFRSLVECGGLRPLFPPPRVGRSSSS